uniref:Uncharacterized protein n=1 Tax=Haptolina brevifila TaxID=156173 RepID=A0A7S2GSV1_9EUKA|mmetsp:Transcript_44807/g.89492  ORF Transcript_44807/g.89492 Transcript_44807/m.89492 type:complete len:119 (+) Transcript_44807:258-614(+)
MMHTLNQNLHRWRDEQEKAKLMREAKAAKTHRAGDGGKRPHGGQRNDAGKPFDRMPSSLSPKSEAPLLQLDGLHSPNGSLSTDELAQLGSALDEQANVLTAAALTLQARARKYIARVE